MNLGRRLSIEYFDDATVREKSTPGSEHVGDRGVDKDRADLLVHFPEKESAPSQFDVLA
jgi:hypothetical protein